MLGKRSASRLTPQQRKDRATKAIQARWGKHRKADDNLPPYKEKHPYIVDHVWCFIHGCYRRECSHVEHTNGKYK